MNTEEIKKTRVMIANEEIVEDCICGSWIKHWEEFSKNTAKMCAGIGCNHDAEVGAHVIETIDSNTIDYKDSCFIVPLCEGHKQASSSFIVSDPLISADPDKTCNKTEYDEHKKSRSL